MARYVVHASPSQLASQLCLGQRHGPCLPIVGKREVRILLVGLEGAGICFPAFSVYPEPSHGSCTAGQHHLWTTRGNAGDSRDCG